MTKQTYSRWYGLFGLFSLYALPGLLNGDWGQAIWLVWAVWFVFFFRAPESSEPRDSSEVSQSNTDSPVEEDQF